ncbi:MAG: FtsB family cell division protein [Christensenellaceae bacterium]|jgi:cell division protein FtsB
MEEMQEKKQQNKRKWSMDRIKLLILVGVAVYAGITLVSQLRALAIQSEKHEKLEQTVAELQREYEYYENTLSYIGTDEYVEKQARERFGWLGEKEIKYVKAQDGQQATEVDLDSLFPSEAVVTSTIIGEVVGEEQQETAAPEE